MVELNVALQNYLGSLDIKRLGQVEAYNTPLVTRKQVRNAQGNLVWVTEGMKDNANVNSTFDLYGDEWVDMGLPSGLLWRRMNLGALKETDYGMYSSWGNVDVHLPEEGYDFSLTNYNASEGAALETYLLTEANDAAKRHLGGKSRMPTRLQFQELFDNNNGVYTYIRFITANGSEIASGTTNKLTTLNGVVGIYIESRLNNNRLFFPCAGELYGTSQSNQGTVGLYWSRSKYVDTSNGNLYGYYLRFQDSGVNPAYAWNRENGLPIRPVLMK